jgi:putative restriction endonuclease
LARENLSAANNEILRKVAGAIIDMDNLVRTRLEKAAADCGFDFPAQVDRESLIFRSTQFAESVGVEVLGPDRFRVTPLDIVSSVSMQEFAQTHQDVEGYSALYSILEQLSTVCKAAFGEGITEKFKHIASKMPSTTEAERLVVQRIGQNLFRNALLNYWQGRCCVTGLAVTELLRASHIKPWANCNSDYERLDLFNGLLLAPHIDALFDGGWLTVQSDGALEVSAHLSTDAANALGVRPGMRADGLSVRHEEYLRYHRKVVFRT